MKLFLQRDYRGDDCTIGKLHIPHASGEFICDTIERPWKPSLVSRGGLKGASCVPEGIYKLEPHNSEAHPNTWALVNPDLDVVHWEDPNRPNLRALVLIHVANKSRELRGCIAPGMRRATDSDGTHMVVSSRLALLEIKRFVLPWDGKHELEIK